MQEVWGGGVGQDKTDSHRTPSFRDIRRHDGGGSTRGPNKHVPKE